MKAPASSLLDILRGSTEYLRDHGSESARLDAELLIAHALGIRRLDLYLQFDRRLQGAELAPIRASLRRRGRGEPVAYIVGVREFFGRDFEVSPAVLIPRPDTETLIEHVLAWCRGEAGHAGHAPLRVADIGTGTGCIAVTLAAELPGAEVVAVDVSPEVLEVASENAERLGVASQVSFLRGSWAVPLAGLAPFDVIVSNPPYITDAEMHELPRDVGQYEPHLALAGGPDGLGPYRDITGALPGLLRTPGLLAMEVDTTRADEVLRLLAAAFPAADVTTVQDLTGRPRVCAASLH